MITWKHYSHCAAGKAHHGLATTDTVAEHSAAHTLPDLMEASLHLHQPDGSGWGTENRNRFLRQHLVGIGVS